MTPFPFHIQHVSKHVSVTKCIKIPNSNSHNWLQYGALNFRWDGEKTVINKTVWEIVGVRRIQMNITINNLSCWCRSIESTRSIFTEDSQPASCFYLHQVLTTLGLLALPAARKRETLLFPHLLIIYGVFKITVTFVIRREGESV